MKTVNVATLKQRLSEYLHLVENGEDIVVTSHRRPVARLVPESASGLRLRLATRPIGDLKKIKGIRLSSSLSAERLLLDDRRRR